MLPGPVDFHGSDPRPQIPVGLDMPDVCETPILGTAVRGTLCSLVFATMSCSAAVQPCIGLSSSGIQAIFKRYSSVTPAVLHPYFTYLLLTAMRATCRSTASLGVADQNLLVKGREAFAVNVSSLALYACCGGSDRLMRLPINVL